jgi:transposase
MKQKFKRKVSAEKLKRRTQPNPYKFWEKIMCLYLEEGYSTTVLREQFGVSSHSVIRLAKAYRGRGSQGLVGEK